MMQVQMDTGRASADLYRWSRGLSRDVAPAYADHAGRVADRVRSSVPRRTGALAGSVTVRSDADSASVVMGTDHARFVEYGGRGFPRSADGNYMGPAVRGLEPQLETTAVRATEQSIRSFPWSQ